MYIETHTRAIIKAISYRFFGSLITAIIIYFFIGRIDFAIAGGALDAIAKIAAFYLHERAWNRIKFGKKKIEPFSIWLTGLPLSGKTTIANLVHEKLKKSDILIEKIDSKDIRDLVPEIGFSKQDISIHLRRIGYLIKTLQNHSISTISAFVSPHTESRDAINLIVKNNIVVYIKADVNSCIARDYKGLYKKAQNGELLNFPAINDIYEEPNSADIVVDTDILSPNEAAEIIVAYIRKKFVKV